MELTSRWSCTIVLLALLLAWNRIRVGATFREHISSVAKRARHVSRFRLAFQQRHDGVDWPHQEEGGPPTDSFSKRRQVSSSSVEEKIAKVDFSKLKPDDPRFILMPWPKDHGPAAQAYGRHFAWKRRLSDSERKYRYIVNGVMCSPL